MWGLKDWDSQLLNAPGRLAKRSQLRWLTPPTRNLQDKHRGTNWENIQQVLAKADGWTWKQPLQFCHFPVASLEVLTRISTKQTNKKKAGANKLVWAGRH